MATLAQPYELLDLGHDQSLSFGVLRYELGDMPIVARHSGESKIVPTMRVWVRPSDKSHGLPYWDITSKTLQAQIKPFLDSPAQRSRVFTVHAQGVRPVKRFSLVAA